MQIKQLSKPLSLTMSDNFNQLPKWQILNLRFAILLFWHMHICINTCSFYKYLELININKLLNLKSYLANFNAKHNDNYTPSLTLYITYPNS